jgi:hypothetical protein
MIWSPPTPTQLFTNAPAHLQAYISEGIAKIAHEVNRSYCEEIGDVVMPAWDECPIYHHNAYIAGVKSVLLGETTNPAEQHAAWMRDKLNDGWVFGAVKDAARKTHPCLVPYTELPQQQRTKDALFRTVVTASFTYIFNSLVTPS